MGDLPWTGMEGTDMTRRYYQDDYDEDEWAERVNMFADPGGNSALRRASKRNPRNLPCPTCKRPNRLTPADRAQGYQCDACADRDEMGGY
tara:strand:+ start:996 stop:1265 length:270 start_codon:yes stop_codon:yes gene_type:complete